MVLETLNPFLELMELVIEMVNFVLAIGVFIVGFGIYKILGDKFKPAWRYLLAVIVFFGIHEIVGILKAFDAFVITGLYEITEMLFIFAFLIALFSFKDLFENMSKKTTPNHKIPTFKYLQNKARMMKSWWP